jgi:ribosomal protein S18 acetylase RimI-like enzyme
MAVDIRDACGADALAVCALVRELAASSGERTPITDAWVREFQSFPGNGMLVAADGGEVVGVLSFSSRPSLFHAGTSGLIEDLVVTARRRRQGIGKLLVEAFLARARSRAWVEVSVSTSRDNRQALDFYRRLGLDEEYVFLEKHF